MISFSPIHKKIQKTLYEKINMLRKTPASVIGTPITDGAEPDKNYMFSRTTWIKATSFTPASSNPNRPVILMGGELDSTGHLKKGYKDESSDINGTITDKENLGLYSAGGGMPFRPLSGIKDISVEYKGGGMRLGATRTATINWTCWNWEDLDRLMQHFLHHGKSVLLEWGWTGIGGSMNDVSTYPATKKNSEGDIIFDKDKCNKMITELPEYIISQNGHYDAMLGVVQNFTWNVRDDGGFDCETTLLAPGVTALQQHFKTDMDDNMKFLPTLYTAKEMKSTGEIAGMEFRAPDTPGFKGDTSIDSDSVIGGSILAGTKETPGYQSDNAEEGNFWTKENGTIPNKLFKDLSPYFNFKSYIASLPEQLKYNYINNPQVSGHPDYPAAIIRPKPFDWNALGGGEDGWKVSIGGGYGMKGCTCTICLETTQESGFEVVENDYYCTWGWFEDNVLSRFFASIGEKSSDKIVIGKFRSIENVYDQTSGKVTSTHSVKIRNAGRQYTTDPLHWLLIKDDPLSSAIKGAVATPLFLFSPREDSPDTQKKYGTCTADEGFIRNIYFRGSYLAKKMVGTNTMEDAIMAVWDDFSSKYGDCYSFKIEFADDGNQVMLKDTGYASNSVQRMLATLKTNEKLEDGTPGAMNGLFEFPIWKDGSIVKSQNLSAKLPDRMQIAAMYGSNNENTDGAKNVKSNENHSAMAYGQIFAPSSGSNSDGLNYEDTQTKRFSDLNTGGLDFPSKRNRSFGNADGNPNDNLYVGNNDGSQASPGDGTIVYPPILKMIKVLQKKELSDRLNQKGIRDNKNTSTDNIDVSKAISIMERAERMLSDDVGNYGGVENWYKWGANGGGEYITKKLQHFVKSDGTIKESWENGFTVYTLAIDNSIHSVMKSHLRGDGAGLSYKSDPLIPLELEIEIDGTGGIFMGNTFQSSYLPVKYRNIACFQVKGVDHKVSADGWLVTIKGQIRVYVPKPKKPPKPPAAPKRIGGVKKVSAQLTTAGIGESIRVTVKAPWTGLKVNYSTTTPGMRSILDKDGDGIIDGSDEFTHIIETTAISSTAVVLGNVMDDGSMEFNELGANIGDLVDTGPVFGGGAVINTKIAKSIVGMDSHWELDHLLKSATIADGVKAGGGRDFLNWFSANIDNPNVIKTTFWSTDHREVEWAYARWYSDHAGSQGGGY